jgi:hypothetical protein
MMPLHEVNNAVVPLLHASHHLAFFVPRHRGSIVTILVLSFLQLNTCARLLFRGGTPGHRPAARLGAVAHRVMRGGSRVSAAQGSDNREFHCACLSSPMLADDLLDVSYASSNRSSVRSCPS